MERGQARVFFERRLQLLFPKGKAKAAKRKAASVMVVSEDFLKELRERRAHAYEDSLSASRR